jgi:hypothetical protein
MTRRRFSLSAIVEIHMIGKHGRLMQRRPHRPEPSAPGSVEALLPLFTSTCMAALNQVRASSIVVKICMGLSAPPRFMKRRRNSVVWRLVTTVAIGPRGSYAA